MTIHKKGLALNGRISAVFRRKATKIGTLFATFLLSVACIMGTILPAKTAGAMQSGVTYSQIGEIWNSRRNRFNSAELTTLFNQLAGTDYTEASKPKDALAHIVDRLNKDESKNNSTGSQAISSTAANHYTHQLTSNSIASKNGGKDIVVEFGGLKWTVVYLSFTEEGDPIATLWLADPLGTSRWSDYWYTKYTTTNMTKQSNLYGQSYIRSETLNAGSRYTTVAGASSTSIKTDITSDASVTWVENSKSYENPFAMFTIDNKETAYDDSGANPLAFTGSVTEFLATPRQVSWQKDQSWSVFGNLDYSLGNDSWDDPYVTANGISGNGAVASTFNYYNSTNGDFRRAYGRTTDSDGDGYGDGQTYNGAGEYKIQYTDWADDYLWLPSLTETGYCNNAATSRSRVGGVWYPSQAQRKSFGGTNDSFSSSDSSWLRSSPYYHASNAHVLSASGNYPAATVSSVAAVRPALHLNLQSAASAARGLDIPEEVETETEKTYTGTEIAGINSIDLTYSEITKVELKKEDNDGNASTATLTTSDYTVKDGVFYATAAGEYSVTFALKATPDRPIWDGTSVDPDTKIPINSADEEIPVNYWEVLDLPDGYTPQGPSDLRLQDQTVTFTIAKAKSVVTDVKLAETGQLYTDGDLPKLVCTTTVTGTIELDAGQRLHHDETVYNWTFSPTGADQYNYLKATGTITLSVKNPLLSSITAVFDVAAYNSAVAAGSALPIYSSTPIENIKGIIGTFTTVTGVKEDGKPYTNPIAYEIDYNAVDKLNGKLTYGTTTVVVSFKDDDMKLAGVDAVTCDISGLPVVAVEMTGITLNTSYKNTYNAYDTFDVTDLVVTATFNDNSTKVIPATDYEIEYADSSRDELWASDTSVIIKYVYTAENGKENSDSKTAAVTVNKIEFTGITFDDDTVPYDGEQHAITAGGTFDGTKMTAVYVYDGVTGSGRVNVGTYTVNAVITFTDSELLTNYNTVVLDSATLKITAVDYDNLNGLTFNNVSAEFIGQSLAEAIKAAGMPAGVTATYTFANDNGDTVAAADVVNAGRYTVTAKFTVDGNHNDIPDKTAVLTITPKTILLNDMSGVNSSYTYVGSAWVNPSPVLKVVLGTDAVATNLVENTDYTVGYQVTVGTAGKAGATVVITVTGKGNYQGAFTKSFSIEKATLNLTWNAGNPQYDGNPHGAVLEVTGGVQSGDETAITTEALAALISITYTKSGATVSGVPSAMGVYAPAFTNFPSTDPYSNYNYVVTNAGYTYEITAAVISGIHFEDLSVEFNGKTQKIEITADNALPADITPEYYFTGTSNPFTGAVNAGTYNVTVRFVSASGNYTAPSDMDAVLTISPKAIGDENVKNIASEYIYKGEAWKPLPSVEVTLVTGENPAVLANERDYTISYSTEDYDAGTTVVVTVTGIGNYTGTGEQTFEIKKATLGVNFIGTDKQYIYNGAVQGVTVEFTGVAASDAETVKPTVRYVSADGVTYDSENLPKNAGSYVVKVTLDGSFTNYESFGELTENFDIAKATPIVFVSFKDYDPNTDKIYSGGDLPELEVVSAVFNGVALTGNVDWQLVSGEKPLLTTELTDYVWEWVPTGDDAVNFNTYTNKIALRGDVPGISSIMVEWRPDVNVPTIYTSTTFEDIRKYIAVYAVLDNNKPAGEITDYTLKGSWGEGVKPINNVTASYDLTVVSANGKTASLDNVQYFKVELTGLQISKADSVSEIKTEYDALTKFDTSTIKVTALYNDGSKVTDITDYSVKYAVDGEDVLWASDSTYVIISYTDNGVTKEEQLNGIKVNSVNYDLTGVSFADTSVKYDGNEHSVTVTGLPDSGMTLEYTYDGAALPDGVTGMVDAGDYTVSVKVTYTDNKYIVNYNALTFADITLTIEKIDYDGVADITFEDDDVDYDGTEKSSVLVATGIPAEVVALGVSYTYAKVEADGSETDCEASDIVNAGDYKVTVSFTVDKNHKDIPSITKTLTINKIDPTINPTVKYAIYGQYLVGAELAPADGDTPGTYEWLNEEHVLGTTNNEQYRFTPTDTVNYNVVVKNIVFTAETKVLATIRVVFNQSDDTKLYTSYTIEDVKKLVDEGKIGVTVTAIYSDGHGNNTEEDVTGYSLYLPNGATHLTAGECYIGVKYLTETNELRSLKVTEVELESIEATFDQKNVPIYSTPDDIETLKTLIAANTVTLTVTGTNNDGKTATEPFTYTITGDWSAMTASGKYSVTVTVDGTSISNTFEVDITLAAISSIKAEFDQKDAEIFTSTDLEGFKQLITDGKVSLIVKAYYNNGKSVEIDLATDTTDGYTLAITGAYFDVNDNTVNVSYEVNGTIFPASFTVDVTEVEVVRVTATVNAGYTVYTDTKLEDLKDNISVVAYRNDGTHFDVTDDFSLSLPDGKTKLELGAQTVILVTYDGADKSADCADFALITGVTKHATQITFTGKTELVYTGSEQVINSGATTTNTQNPKITYTIGGAEAKFTDRPANGELVLKISAAETDDYFAAEITITLTVSKADIDMSGVDFADAKYTYDDTASRSITVDATQLPAGVVVNDYEYIDANGTTLATSSVTAAGVYKVTVTFTVTDTNNYNLVSPKMATLTIEKASYDMTGVTFDGATFGYDGTLKTITVDASQLPAGVTVKEYVYTNTVTGQKVTDTGVKDAGDYTVSVSFDIADGTNFNAVPDMTATLKITKATLTIDTSAIVTDYTYDGQSHTVNGAVMKDTDGNELTEAEVGSLIEYSSNNTFKDVPVGGKLTVTITVKDSTNYIGATESVEITVNKVALTVTANNKTIFYGDAPANDGIKDPVGFVNGETVADLKGAAVYSYNYAQGGNVGPYDITVSGYTSANYDITYVDGTLTVLAKSVAVEWSTETFTYDGKGHAPTAVFPVIGGGKQSMDVTIAVKGGAAVTGLPVNADTYTATATSTNGNYTFTNETYDFTIDPADIIVTGTGDQFRLGGDTDITLDATESGKYKFVILQSGVTSATFKYTVAYPANGAYPKPEDEPESSFNSNKPATIATAGTYVINYSIVAPNHKEYRGQWIVEVTDDSVKSVTVTFKNSYSVEFGNVPSTETELDALAQALYDNGYIEIDGMDADEFLKFMQLRLRVDNSSDATADTEVGRYTPYFECRTGFESVYGDYVIFYKTENTADDTNVGKFEIKQKELTVTWDSVGFVADGTLHLPKATVSGFNDGSTVELVLDSAAGKTFKVEADGRTLNLTIGIHGDLTSAGGHQLIVSVDDGNYTVANPITTISITPPVTLTVEWENTSIVYDGELHLPKATIKGFAGGKTFDIALATADGGSFEFELDGVKITFNVSVAGSGNVFTDVGVYALTVTSNSANYVISNPNGSVKIIAPRTLVVTWNQTTFDDNGSAHYPSALISGFFESKPVTIQLDNVSGGVFKVNVDGKTVTFEVSVDGIGQLLRDVGNYNVLLTVDDSDYVINNSNVTMTVRALVAGEVEGKLSTPWLIGLIAALVVLFIMIIIAYIIAAKRKASVVGIDEGGFSEPYMSLDYMESAAPASDTDDEDDEDEE